ncbi:hypothetical protein MSKU15_0638 [Komagataeibacter diospyri]|nr:hypothetical protein MSKU15_0638 [Komagataeibacter diospyri]
MTHPVAASKAELPPASITIGIDVSKGYLDAEGPAGKKLVTPGLRRDAVAWAIQEKDYSQRRTCRLIGMDPKTWRYASRHPDDAEACGRLRDLAGERRRFGYRRLHILPEREGATMNHKKLFSR